jgi:hypothetical protein
MKKKTTIVNVLLPVFLVLFLLVIMPFTNSRSAFAQAANPPAQSLSIEMLFEILNVIIGNRVIPNTAVPSPSPGVIIDDKGRVITPTPIRVNEKGQSTTNFPNFVYYCQGNTQMQVCRLGSGGCGPTSLAMVFNSYGLAMDPLAVDAEFRERGWRTCSSDGSMMVAALTTSDWVQSLGFHVGPDLVFNTILDLQQTEEFLKNGYLIIGSSLEFPCVKCSTPTNSHIFVIDGIDKATGIVSIRDPNNCSYADGNDEIAANRYRHVSSFPWYYAYPIKYVK